MRDLHELINEAEDRLSQIEDWARKSPRTAEILPVNRAAGAATLVALQVTTRSILGALAFRTGGVFIDRGWMRHLGSGHARLGGGLVEWNASHGGDPLDPPLDGALVVAYDVLGGFFAINSGAFDGSVGSMHYWAPDRQIWEPMDIGHGAFVAWSMTDSLDKFYEGSRWSGWEVDVAALGPDQGLAMYPPLGFSGPRRELISMSDRHRSPAPMRELWTEYHEIAREIGHLPDGAEVRFEVTD